MVELIYAGITHKSAKRTRLAPLLLLANPSSSAALFCFPVAVAAGWRRADERSLQRFGSTIRCPPTVIAESAPIRVSRTDDSPVRASTGTDLMLPRYPHIPAGLITICVLLLARLATSSFPFVFGVTCDTPVRLTVAFISGISPRCLFLSTRGAKNSFPFVFGVTFDTSIRLTSAFISGIFTRYCFLSTRATARFLRRHLPTSPTHAVRATTVV